MKKLFSVLLVLTMLLSVSSCGNGSDKDKDSSDPNASLTNSSVAEGGIIRGGTLKVGKGIILSTLNPTKVTARDSDYDVICQIYEPLIRSDKSGNLVPGLAESWELSDDTTIVMHLRKGVKFHDGTVFNAKAVKANFDYFMDPSVAAIFATELAVINDVKVVDDSTVEIKLKKPSSAFLMELTNYSGLMIAPAALERGAEYLASNACGTGPFKVRKYVYGVSIDLEANKDYYLNGEDGKPLPYLDAVTITMITDQTTKVNSLLAGDVDLTDYLTATGIQQVKANSNFSVTRTTTADIYCLFCKVDDEVLSNRKVRQALAYAVDREQIASLVTRGQGFSSIWACDPDQWFYSDYNPYVRDVAKAKSLLADAGYPEGVTLKMQCISREPDNTAMQIVQQQLEEAGFTLKLESMERTAWNAVWMTEHTGQLGMAKVTVPRVTPYVQLNTNLGKTSANNYTLYEGKEFNEMLDGLSSIYDREKQKEVLNKMQKVYLDDCATIFLFELPRCDSYSKKVQNFSVLPLGPWNLAEIWLAK